MNRTNIPDWALARGALLNRFSSIDTPHTALINIDMQRAFVEPDAALGNPHAIDIIDNINSLSSAMRKAGGQVAWTRQTYTDKEPLAPPDWHYDPTDPWVNEAMGDLRETAGGHALHPNTQPSASDTIIDKYRYGAFSCPAGALEAWLQKSAIDTIIITGTVTNCCCESTAREAHMAGYKVFFISDATAAATDEEHNAALLNLCLMFAVVRTTKEMISLIAQGVAADT